MNRRRSWPRRVAAGALALAALVALRIVLGKSLGDWVAARERARFEREVGPLDTARLAAPPVRDEENVVPAIVAAVADLALTAEEHRLLTCSSRCGELRGAPGAAVDALLERRRDVLDALHAAALRSRSSFGPRHELFRGRPVDLTAWLAAARLVATGGERASSSGDEARARAALRTLHGMTLALRREPISVFAIVGGAVETIELDLVHTRLAGALGADALAEHAAALEALRELPSVVEVLHGEAAFGHDMLRRTPVAPRLAGSPRERIEALLWPWSAGHVEAGYLADWRDLARLAAAPQTSWPPIETIVGRRHGRLRQWLDPTAPLRLFRAALLPNLLEIARNLQFLDASEQLGALAVAVAQARVASGTLPVSLDGFAAAARPDAATAERPSYRLDADGATVELRTARERLERALASAPAGQRHVYERRLRLLRWRIPHDGTSLAGDATEPAAIRQEKTP